MEQRCFICASLDQVGVVGTALHRVHYYQYLGGLGLVLSH